MADFAVTTVFKSKDGITGNFKRMGAAAGKFGRKSRDSFNTANRAGLTFKKTLAAILSAGVISRGFGLMTRGARAATEEFVTFDDAITRAGAKFPETVTRGTAGFRQLQKVAREVGATTKFSATEAAEGLDFLAMAGFNAEQAMAALPQVTNLAVVAGEDLARSTDIASDALGSFGLMTKDSAQLTENLARINDVFAKTVTSANTDMEMLFESMKDGGPVLTAAGASMETFAALTGVMANAGIKGTKAGTTLKNMFLKLQAPVPAAQKAIKKLGLELIDNEGNLRDITEILGDFNKATAKMGKAQRSAAIDTIFGKRAIAGVSVLLAEGEKGLKDYRQTLIDAGGSAQKMADIIGTSLGNRLKALRSAAIELAFKFIDSFEKKIPGAIDNAIEAVRKFDVKPIIDGVRTFAKWVKAAVKAIKFLAPALTTLVLAKTAYLVITKAIFAFEAAKWFFALAKATQAATVAQGLLNVAMTANPIGMVIAGTALVVAAGWTYANNINKINDHAAESWVSFDKTFEGVKNDYILGLDLMAEHAGKSAITTDSAFRKLSADIKLGHDSMATHAVRSWDAVGIAFDKALNDMMDDAALTFMDINKFFDDLPDIAARAWAGVFKSFKALTDDLLIGWEAIKKAFSVQSLPAGTPRAAAPGVKAPVVAPEGAGREAPNAAEVAAQNIRFKGKLTVAGAPEGSTLEAETVGAPPVQTELLGANL